jgi:hypothetical protein
MNCRRRVLAATLVLTIGLLGAAAQGQPTGGPATGGNGAGAAPAGAAAKPVAPPSPPAPVTIPQQVYTSPMPAAITAFITPNMANLTNDADPVGQAKSRDNLTAAVFYQGAPASPAFLFAYASALDTAATAALAPAKKPTMRQRLNIAIVVAKVATVAQNASLATSTTILINDPAEPVVLWGLKAATAQVKHVLTVKIGNKLPPMVAAIVPAATKTPSGPIVDEAYAALGTTQDPDVVGELMKLWGHRLALYRDGKDVPEEPAADGKPVFTLTTAEMWKGPLAKPDLQVKVMQNISDQVSVAAQWADLQPPGDKRDQLVKLVQQCAAGAFVVGKNTNNQALVQAATLPASINLQQMPQNTKVLPMVEPGLTSAIQAAFPGVKPPPKVGNAPAGAGVAAP